MCNHSSSICEAKWQIHPLGNTQSAGRWYEPSRPQTHLQPAKTNQVEIWKQHMPPKNICMFKFILTLYNDDNDNNMTFVGTYRLFVALEVTFSPSLCSGANVATRGTHRQYALQKSCYFLIVCNYATNRLIYTSVLYHVYKNYNS